MKIRLIIGICMIIGGVVALAKALDVNKNVELAIAWPYTDGEIIKSELVASSYARNHTTYSPEVEYSYTVNDEQYTANLIMFGETPSGRFSKMQKIYIDHYEKGSIVKVYYNPTDPQNAVLKPHEGKGATLYYLLASALAVWGAAHVINFFTGFGENLMAWGEN